MALIDLTIAVVTTVTANRIIAAATHMAGPITAVGIAATADRTDPATVAYTTAAMGRTRTGAIPRIAAIPPATRHIAAHTGAIGLRRLFCAYGGATHRAAIPSWLGAAGSGPEAGAVPEGNDPAV